MRTHRSWLSRNIRQCEALLEELYRERDCAQLPTDQRDAAERVEQLTRSVVSRRHYERRVQDPVWLEQHRRRSREHYRKKVDKQQAEQRQERQEQRQEHAPERPMSFRLVL